MCCVCWGRCVYIEKASNTQITIANYGRMIQGISKYNRNGTTFCARRKMLAIDDYGSHKKEKRFATKQTYKKQISAVKHVTHVANIRNIEIL